MSGRSPYLKLDRQIAASDRGGIVPRWKYGRELLAARAGRKGLPHGMAADLIQAAQKIGIKLSDAEIRYRLQCAEAYDTEAKLVTAVTSFGSWTALRDAGFPPADAPADESDFAELGVLNGPPDTWTGMQLTFDVPGWPEAIGVRKQKIPLTDATVTDGRQWIEDFRERHANYGKTLATAEASWAAIEEASGGDDEMTIAQAWRIATGDQADDPADPAP